jgi:hypothetical protein
LLLSTCHIVKRRHIMTPRERLLRILPEV